MNELETKIVELYKEGGLKAKEEIETLLETALKEDPDNIDLLLKLALTEFHLPLPYDKKISALEKIFIKDPNNPHALLILACIQYYCIGIVDEDLFQRLTLLTTGDSEIDSMLRYVASWFYDNYNNNMSENDFEKLLLESISKYSLHVNNYERLAELYLRQNRPSEARAMLQNAFKNVVKRCDEENRCYDITNVQHFLEDRIKGTYLSLYNLHHLQSLESESMLREKLLDDPHNIELLLQLAIKEKNDCNFNYDRGIESLKKILSFDPNNAKALLFLAHISQKDRKFIDESLFQKLTSIKADDPEINSMLLYAASWFYANKDDKKQEELLRQSIQEYPKHVLNYIELAKLCAKHQRTDEAKVLKQMGLNNVIKIYSDEDLAKGDQVEIFLNENFKGSSLSDYTLNLLKEIKI